MTPELISTTLAEVLEPAPGARTSMADIHAAVVAKTGTIGKLPFSAVKDVLRAAGVGLIPDGRETLAKDVALTPGAATAGLNVRIRNSLGRR